MAEANEPGGGGKKSGGKSGMGRDNPPPEREQQERERAEREKQERERAEREKQGREKQERERAERERQEREKQERERAGRERAEREQQERERQEREKQERERQEHEREARERAEREQQEREKRGKSGAGEKPPTKPPTNPPKNPPNEQAGPRLGFKSGEELPPPGVRGSRSTWHWTPPAEREGLWSDYRERRARSGPPVPTNLNAPPPDSDIPMPAWRAMDPDERMAEWARYRAGVRPDERIVNKPLLDFLVDPKNGAIQTVQDLINTLGSGTAFNNWCLQHGLVPLEVIRYRDLPLRNLAVLPPVAPKGVPSTAAQANAYFLTQYKDEVYNPFSPRTGSNNCGPASVAMMLRVSSRMPDGLNTEEQIDYARALMYPDLARTSGIDKTLPDGRVVRLLDRDGDLTSLDKAAAGAQNAGLPRAARQVGWDAFEHAMADHQPIVLAGNISLAWRDVFAQNAQAPGSYAAATVGTAHFIAILGTTNAGEYIVADPMFSGGTVILSRNELSVFLTQQPPDATNVVPDPSFVNPDPPPEPGS